MYSVQSSVVHGVGAIFVCGELRVVSGAEREEPAWLQAGDAGR